MNLNNFIELKLSEKELVNVQGGKSVPQILIIVPAPKEEDEGEDEEGTEGRIVVNTMGLEKSKGSRAKA